MVSSEFTVVMSARRRSARVQLLRRPRNPAFLVAEPCPLGFHNRVFQSDGAHQTHCDLCCYTPMCSALRAPCPGHWLQSACRGHWGHWNCRDRVLWRQGPPGGYLSTDRQTDRQTVFSRSNRYMTPTHGRPRVGSANVPPLGSLRAHRQKGPQKA